MLRSTPPFSKLLDVFETREGVKDALHPPFLDDMDIIRKIRVIRESWKKIKAILKELLKIRN